MMQSIYDLHVIPEFPYPVIAGVLALGGVIAARLGLAGKNSRM
jgi:hypothetical protein